MKVLVVSDTHGRDESLEMAVALEQPFDYLIPVSYTHLTLPTTSRV